MASPKTPNRQSRALSSVEAAQDEVNKPNYVLIAKVTNEGTIGTHIRTWMYETITAKGWKTPNTTTSQFYYKRADVGDEQVRAETDEFLSEFVANVKQAHPDNPNVGINWMVLKPLPNSQSLKLAGEDGILAALFGKD